MNKLLFAFSFTALLPGCALTGGTAAYTLEPVAVGGGNVVCCKVTIHNSKDYDKFKFEIEKKPDGTIIVSLDERGVSSSDPAAVASENQSKLIDAVTKLIPVGN